MPRYQVITVRALYNGIVIDAESEEDAKAGNGDIIDEAETDTWCESTHSVEQVADDCDAAELP